MYSKLLQVSQEWLLCRNDLLQSIYSFLSDCQISQLFRLCNLLHRLHNKLLQKMYFLAQIPLWVLFHHAFVDLFTYIYIINSIETYLVWQDRCAIFPQCHSSVSLYWKFLLCLQVCAKDALYDVSRLWWRSSHSLKHRVSSRSKPDQFFCRFQLQSRQLFLFAWWPRLFLRDQYFVLEHFARSEQLTVLVGSLYHHGK